MVLLDPTSLHVWNSWSASRQLAILGVDYSTRCQSIVASLEHSAQRWDLDALHRAVCPASEEIIVRCDRVRHAPGQIGLQPPKPQQNESQSLAHFPNIPRPDQQHTTLIAMLDAASPKMFEAASPRNDCFEWILLSAATSRKIGNDQILTSPLAEPDNRHSPLGCSASVLIAVSCAFDMLCSTRRWRISNTLIDPPSPPEINS